MASLAATYPYSYTHLDHSCAPPTLLSYPRAYISTFFDRAAKAGLATGQAWRRSGMGYYLEQSTKPQTLGYSLADSPVGLLAWIYEKLVGWSDKYPWTDDEGEYRFLQDVIVLS